MQTLKVDVGHSRYLITIGAGLLGNAALVESQVPGKNLMIVTDTTVARLYLPALRHALGDRQMHECILADGEPQKTLQTVSWIFDTMVGQKLNRDAVVVALGGGVVGDIAGFAAACYQRGVRFVQIPTTVLAQVDSSVGGKTGVNHNGGKNLIGAFHQPVAVIADTDTLKSLPDREVSRGHRRGDQVRLHLGSRVARLARLEHGEAARARARCAHSRDFPFVLHQGGGGRAG